MGWERRTQQQGGCCVRVAFQSLSREAAAVIHRQLQLQQAGSREASPGALKMGAEQSQMVVGRGDTVASSAW